VNAKVPDEFAVTVVSTGPVRDTEAPAPAAIGVMVPEILSVPDGAGIISTSARFQRSVVGAVSLIVTVVPATGVGAFCIWTQYVSPEEVKS